MIPSCFKLSAQSFHMSGLSIHEEFLQKLCIDVCQVEQAEAMAQQPLYWEVLINNKHLMKFQV